MRVRIKANVKGPLNWRALQAFDPLLVRRAGDRGEWMIGAGARSVFTPAEHSRPSGTFHALQAWLVQQGDHAMGYLAYDLKNEVEALSSRYPDSLEFGPAYWFVPRFMVVIKSVEAQLLVYEEDREAGEEFLDDLLRFQEARSHAPLVGWRVSTSKRTYMDQVRGVLDHIQRGDVYELNYCVERSTTQPGWDPIAGFERLLDQLDAPHAAFVRVGHRHAVSASPERFLRFDHGKVVAQPMKGTRPRHGDPAIDRVLAEELAVDPKERAENIMAVDVMRNDLSRVASSRSVRVEELCAVKTYPAVHQMVSTVSATLREGVHPIEAIKAAWPMASMTGAPKVRALQLIDEMEDQRRGLYSGSIGFFDPAGVVDLNVVIRTVLYDATTGRCSLTTGGALTTLCDPEREWEECELKALSVINALGHA